MKQYGPEKILNIALTGHAGAGKTSLAEAILYTAGATDRIGNIESGTTVCDYDPEEIKRKASLSCALAPIEWNGYKFNLIDTPGLFDFEGEQLEGMIAADSAVIVVSGKSGVHVGTEKAWKRVCARGIPRAFFISKIDDETADFFNVLEGLKSAFGASICPVVVPFAGGPDKVYVNLIEMKAYRYDDKGKASEVPVPDTGGRIEELVTAMSEAVAETSDELLEKYFSGNAFTKEELIAGIHEGVKNGAIAPVFCGSGVRCAAMDLLLNGLCSLLPDYAETQSQKAPSGETVAFVFKTIADPFIGKLSFIKVLRGEIRSDSTLTNSRTGSQEKIGKLFIQRGKKQTDTESLTEGDIGVASKLACQTGDMLTSQGTPAEKISIDFPAPCLSMAVTAKNKGDEDKITQCLHRLCEEDPTIQFEMNNETRQLILSGLGEQHLDYIVSKLKAKFGVEVTLSKPDVPYREAIRKKVKAEGKHKKQTGGHGQYGHVIIEFEPCPSDDLIFEEKVFGGAVPRNYFPAVEKGLRECVRQGVLAGYPVVNLKATLLDGSYHPVDSSEASFKAAAALAFRSGLIQADPVLLEPIGLLKAYVPESTMGDVIGEINRRRGRVLGMEPDEDGLQRIEAEAPVAETLDFAVYLRSATQGRGRFTFEFVRYEEAPPAIAQAVIEKAKAQRANANE